MKNVLNNIKKGILMVTMFVTVLSFANEASFYIRTNAKTTSITLNNVKQGNQLSIKDENGTVLYNELIQKTGRYAKGFDLTLLPEGDYIFELDKDMEVSTIPFTVKATNIVVNRALEKTTFKPYVNQKGDMLFISKLATDLEAMKISIYTNQNSEFQLLYSEKVGGINTIKRIYKLEKGNYKIIINSDNKEYTTFINN